MSLERREVEHIALLARIGLSEAELQLLREQLSDIIEQFQILEQVDTTDVPPTSHTMELSSVYREDRVCRSSTTSEILANAPESDNDFFKVKAILG